MKIKTWLALSLGLLLAPLQAHAWGAAASNAEGGGHIYVGAFTSADAARQAVEACTQRTRLPCKLAFEPVRGSAIVVAKGATGRGTAARADPQEAAQAALESCRKVSKGCRLVNAAWDGGPNWVAFAEGPDSYFVHFNAGTRDDAIRLATQACDKEAGTEGVCKVGDGQVSDALQYYAKATSARLDRAWYAFDLNSMKAAEDEALRRCAAYETRPTDCAVTHRHTNHGWLPEPAGMKQVKAQIERSSPANAGGAASPSRTGGARPQAQPAPTRPRCINPATGLPMILTDGSCAGVDVGGNPYGMRRMQ